MPFVGCCDVFGVAFQKSTPPERDPISRAAERWQPSAHTPIYVYVVAHYTRVCVLRIIYVCMYIYICYIIRIYIIYVCGVAWKPSCTPRSHPRDDDRGKCIECNTYIRFISSSTASATLYSWSYVHHIIIIIYL